MSSELLKTSIKENHDHFCIVDEVGNGVTSKVLGHAHPIKAEEVPFTDANGEPVIDPNTGAPVIEKVVLIALSDITSGIYHEHAVLDQLIYNKKERQEKKEKEYVDIVKSNFKESEDYEFKFRSQAKECERFQMLDQWDDDIKAKLKKQKRAALVIPEANSKMDFLSGVNRQNRTEPRVIPVEAGDTQTADIFDLLVKHFLEKNCWPQKDAQLFEDQINLGRGVVSSDIDFSFDIRGNIKISVDEWDETFLGPHNSLDATDMEHAEKIKFMSIDQAQNIYPEKKEELESVYLSAENHFKYSNSFLGPIKNYFTDHITKYNNEDFDFKRKMVRIIEAYLKEYRRIDIVYYPLKGLYIEVPEIEKKDLEEILTIPGIVSTKVTKVDIRRLTVAGTLLLDNFIYDIDEIPIVPVYAKKRKDKVISKMAEAMDMQKEVNKRHSQFMDILNKASHWVRYISRDIFSDDDAFQRYKEQASTPGAIIEVEDIERIPRMEDGTRIPNEVIQGEQISSSKMNTITNISPAAQGQADPRQSGKSLQNQQRAGLTGNDYLFDNKSFAIRQLVKIMIKQIQVVMKNDPSRVARIIDNRHIRNKLNGNGKEDLMSLSNESLNQIMLNTNATEYDVAVTDSNYSPTKRAQVAAVWTEIAAARPDVPLAWLIDMSDDIPEEGKQKFFELQSQQAALESQQAQTTANSEVEKSKIAAQSRVTEAAIKAGSTQTATQPNFMSQ